MRLFCLAILSLCLPASPILAAEYRSGGKLLLTDGISTVEGAGGGGIASWATIAGQETDAGIGGAAHATLVALPAFTLTALGASIGLRDRVELSYGRQRFDTRAAGAALGLGRGFTFGQDIVGAKLRLVGDAVYDQDRWLPQISVGIQYKRANQDTVVRAVGAAQSRGTDLYVAATKLLLAEGLVLNGTLRWTKANQLGLLGFGGDGRRGRSVQFEGSAAKLLSSRLVVGAEFRSKPDNLRFAREDHAFDLFAAWAIARHLTVTAAYADLGSIATVRRQRGPFLSLRTAF
ncbi:hypothetical protein GCM10011380_13310 [Sphingomonas metalli]|uniref:DUF3034 family protein n=1 Tax=Sphingomonas metalli TaxID=1779358 RepID=A0A916T083_9SPHN|nr:DUF3034 family protein [Sphingomonas metalli]GGB25069.1 hypothetical protein GCM10011380_13310 [Sphingomonas metalli]